MPAVLRVGARIRSCSSGGRRTTKPRSSPSDISTSKHGKAAPVSLKSATQARTTGHSASRSSPAAIVANAVTAVKPAAIKRIDAFFTPRPAALLRAPFSSDDALRNLIGSCIAERRIRGIGGKRGDEDGHEASGR